MGAVVFCMGTLRHRFYLILRSRWTQFTTNGKPIQSEVMKIRRPFVVLAACSSIATALTTRADIPGVVFPEGSCAASCGSASDKASGVSVSVSPCTYDPTNPTPGE